MEKLDMRSNVIIHVPVQIKESESPRWSTVHLLPQNLFEDEVNSSEKADSS